MIMSESPDMESRLETVPCSIQVSTVEKGDVIFFVQAELLSGMYITI
jgi:hypothetical protein